MVHGIVVAAGGTVRVYSELGRGTTIRVYLPAVGTETVGAPSHEEPIPGGTERILVLDDETMIVEMLAKTLSSLGYRVTIARTAAEALEAFRTDPARFDAVITDLTMPRMDGEAVARALLEARPHLPVLVCTGFSEELTSERLRGIGVREVLAKPVPRARLARALRAALESSTAP